MKCNHSHLIKAHTCEICHATFSRPENCLRHKRNSHRAADFHPYLCSCGRSYTRSDILLRHQRGCDIHNGVSPEQQRGGQKKRGRKPKAIHQHFARDPSYLAGVAAASHQQQQQQGAHPQSQSQAHSQGFFCQLHHPNASNSPLTLEHWAAVPPPFEGEHGLDSE